MNIDGNNMSAFLPTDLFEDSPSLTSGKQLNLLSPKESSTNYSATDGSMIHPNRCPLKHKTTPELSNEEVIKRQLQPFSKKMSDYTLQRAMMFPQFSVPQQPTYSTYPQMMMMTPVVAPQFMFVPPKAKMTQDVRPPSMTTFPNQSIRMNKKFKTFQQLNCFNYGSARFDDEKMLSEMSIKQIIEKFGPVGFVAVIKTCKGSRAVQKKLSRVQSTEIDLVLLSLMNNLQEVMCDYYGNYFLQKLFSCCSPPQRISIYKNMKHIFDIIAHHACGTHSIQSLIVLSSTKEEEAIIKQYTEPNLLMLSLSTNSTHIISKIIFSIPEQRREYINNFVISNLINLTLHSNGICLVKAFIANNQDENIAKMLITIFELDTVKVISNQYGNFGIQELIRRYGFEPCARIIKKIKDKIVLFSSMKYSSNVIDFVISYSHSYNKELFGEITSNLFLNLATFEEMTKNKYGNFVLENAILLLDRPALVKVKEFMTSNGSLTLVKDKEKKVIKLIRNVKC